MANGDRLTSCFAVVSLTWRTILSHFRGEFSSHHYCGYNGPTATFAGAHRISGTPSTPRPRFGFAPAAATFERRVLGPSGFDNIIDLWLPLACALNMLNRSMGKDDLYPIVPPAAVLEKMRFIHTVIDAVTSDPVKLAAASGGD